MACSDMSIKQCKACIQGDSFCPQSFMKCTVNRWRDCSSESECLDSGRCDDWELLAADGVPSYSGACVLPFYVGAEQVSCYDGVLTQLGCILYKVPDPQSCQEIYDDYYSYAYATWVTPAETEKECAAYGNGCLEPAFDFVTRKDTSDCLACDGQPINFFEWRAGHWNTAHTRKLEWRQRKFYHPYQWTTKLSVHEAYELVKGALTDRTSARLKAEALCR